MNSQKQKYVLGFLFDPLLEKVLLIKKRKPDFMFWKLNGIGGKIEPGEIPDKAMTREFKEEVGLEIDSWIHYATFFNEAANYEVFVYAAVDGKIYDFRWLENEEPEIYEINLLHCWCRMPNIDWLIKMAINRYLNLDKTKLFIIEEI